MGFLFFTEQSDGRKPDPELMRSIEVSGARPKQLKNDATTTSKRDRLLQA